MKIGVFDSGIGGLSVAKAIEMTLPEHTVIFRNDAHHVPYGTKPIAEILGYVEPILQSLVDDGCQVIVIACNTVSTNLIKELRAKLSVPLIAMEPMVKPAAERTKSGVIAVCATPATLASKRYVWLKSEYAQGIEILEPDCSSWSYMIEHNKVDEELIANEINAVLAKKADVIVLGCTHYHWIETEIKALAGERAVVLQPELPVIAELKRKLQDIQATAR